MEHRVFMEKGKNINCSNFNQLVENEKKENVEKEETIEYGEVSNIAKILLTKYNEAFNELGK